ncbi:MAG: hypothetical protein JW861_05905 [Bacteroidales bacterium]|nr:hypothetical protein [Bacteroidales bacterium]
MKSILHQWFPFAGMILLVSCSPEWKLAREYFATKPSTSVMILPAEFVFKTSHKEDIPEDTSGWQNWQADTALMNRSTFIQYLSDSIILESYINSMINEFSGLGFHVYLEDHADEFLFTGGRAYILNIAQIEVEEYYWDYYDSEELGGMVYSKTLTQEAVGIHFWLEFTQLNPRKEGRRLFYDLLELQDEVDGYFTESLFTGEVTYKYFISELEPSDIHSAFGVLGRIHAGYVMDFIMNQYIGEHLPPGRVQRYYLHFNRAEEKFEPASRDRFEVLE